MTHDATQNGHAPQLKEKRPGAHGNRAYGLFALNMVLSFLAMYFLMYTMIDTWADFFHNLNMGYMAMTMLAAMGIIMISTMPGMYPNKRLNIAIVAFLIVAFVLSLAGIRTQTPIGDQQFIASMIPHHSGAILMCREAQITDSELRSLCDSIQQGQRQEIEQMRAILARLQ